MNHPNLHQLPTYHYTVKIYADHVDVQLGKNGQQFKMSLEHLKPYSS